uniref:Uncharacterized protein n=1 Tax=Arundo donax TaxID=35708 RepID=A0A0A8XWW8_ARUDO
MAGSLHFLPAFAFSSSAPPPTAGPVFSSRPLSPEVSPDDNLHQVLDLTTPKKQL